MKKPTQARHVRAEQLLAEYDMTIEQLADLLGVAYSTARHIMQALVAADRAHVVRIDYRRRGQAHYGAGPANAPKIARPAPVKRASIARRDPLVTALYGPAANAERG